MTSIILPEALVFCNNKQPKIIYHFSSND